MGRPKLPEDVIQMRRATLLTAVKLLFDKITDTKYMKGLKPREFAYFLEIAFDRCGLPKVMINEILTDPASLSAKEKLSAALEGISEKHLAVALQQLEEKH